MRHHPLTPMTDASLVRVLARQTPHKVGLVAFKQVQARFRFASRTALDALAADGVRHVVVDAVGDADLTIIGEAVGDDLLVTGGSGRRPRPARSLSPARAAAARGRCRRPAVGRGRRRRARRARCSAATLGQVAAFKRPGISTSTPTPPAAASRSPKRRWRGPGRSLATARSCLSASDAPEAVKALQAKYGVEKSSQAIERTHGGARAKGLVSAGVRRLVVAGGETSGAVVGALGRDRALRIGPEIDPGVPWTASLGDRPLALALKSGNFGAPDFFTKAFARP